MLGSVAEAEDVVQEALLRLHRALEDGQRIDVPARLRGDRRHPAGDRPAALGAAPGARRYVGEWLPEPLVADAARTTRRATPRWPTPCRSPSWCCWRASRRSSAPCSCCATCSTTATTRSPRSSARARQRRQLAPARAATSRRAGRASRRPGAARRAGPSASSRPPSEGDLEALEALLAEDVVLHGDGGGKVPALARSLHGRGRVARTLAAWARRGARSPEPRRRVGRGQRPARRALLDGEAS